MGAIPKLEECNPGLRATGFALVVAIEAADEASRGGIIIPQGVRDKEEIVQQRGRIVDMSPAAFDFATFPPEAIPQVGSAILFAKLAGFRAEGADGRHYRILQDRDVACIIEEAA